MKIGRLLLLLFLVSPTGCSFVGYGIHNIVEAPCEAVQDCVFRCKVRHLAHQAWRTVCDEGGKFSAAYEHGFEDGFVDYVDANGTGEPPAIPPPAFRNRLLRSDAGQNDIVDWYAGFRHGARVAHEQGLREQVILPIGRPARTPTEPIPAQVVPMQQLRQTMPEVSRVVAPGAKLAQPVQPEIVQRGLSVDSTAPVLEIVPADPGIRKPLPTPVVPVKHEVETPLSSTDEPRMPYFEVLPGDPPVRQPTEPQPAPAVPAQK